jgi:hypothetical protein
VPGVLDDHALNRGGFRAGVFDPNGRAADRGQARGLFLSGWESVFEPGELGLDRNGWARHGSRVTNGPLDPHPATAPN